MAFCSISDTEKIEKMQLKALRHIYKDCYTYELLRDKCNKPMLLIEREKAIHVYMNYVLDIDMVCSLKKVELMIIGSPQY